MLFFPGSKRLSNENPVTKRTVVLIHESTSLQDFFHGIVHFSVMLLNGTYWQLRLLFFIGAIITLLVSLFLHYQLNNRDNIELENTAPRPRQWSSKLAKTETSKPVLQERLERIKEAVQDAEIEILDFFQGEKRALEDGSPTLLEDAVSPVLSHRLANRIIQCAAANLVEESSGDECTLRAVFVGSAQMSGRDNLRNQTFPFMAEKRLRNVAEAAGLRLELLNHAFDNDVGREGPQTCHMCILNLLGKEVDVIGWGFDDSMQAGRLVQFEAFVRWAYRMKPALIIVNREGPHNLSRRSKKRGILDISPGHTAVVYEDSDPPPEPRKEPYRKSTTWHSRWEKRNNAFWRKLFKHYSSNMDFAAVDPAGAIWHLDHLQEFSNAAFEYGKALALLDCGHPGHPPPCDQYPQFVRTYLETANLSTSDLPDDTDGILCGGMWGCRHSWYGGPRSHLLRGELNALPMIRAFRDAVKVITTSTKDVAKSINVSQVLPPPMQCPSVFCDRTPICSMSYEPNLASSLGRQLVVSEKSPQLGAVAFANNPKYQREDIEKRFAPLGYIDRKYAYRIAVGKEDASSAAVNFVSNGGPLVVCEPPCFADFCPSKRKMPLLEHATFELDGVNFTPTHNITTPLIGKYCTIMVEKLAEGSHTITFSTAVKAPFFVMFSHVISF